MPEQHALNFYQNLVLFFNFNLVKGGRDADATPGRMHLHRLIFEPLATIVRRVRTQP